MKIMKYLSAVVFVFTLNLIIDNIALSQNTPNNLGWWAAVPSGQGIRFDRPDNVSVEGVWYTFNESSQPQWWLLLNSSINGNSITFDLFQVTGTSMFLPWNGNSNASLGGSATVTFQRCDQAMFNYTVGNRSGAIQIEPFNRYGIAEPGCNPITNPQTIDMRGKWSVTTTRPNCSLQEVGTWELTYSNGIYSAAYLSSNGLDISACRSVGSYTCGGGDYQLTVTQLTKEQVRAGMHTFISGCIDGAGVNSATIDSDNQVTLRGTYFGISYSSVMTRQGGTSGNGNDGLVAYYKFDGNAADSSGNSNNGIENGGVDYRPGRYGQAAFFDGIDDYIYINNSNSINLSGDFTLSAWINPDHFGTVLAKGGTQQLYSRYSINLNYEDNGRIRAWAGDGSVNNFIDSNYLSIKSAWQHILYTYTHSNRQVKIYINGALDKTDTVVDGVTKTNGDLVIGRSDYDNPNTGIPDEYGGLIDEVRIYDRVLSDQEIINLASSQ